MPNGERCCLDEERAIFFCLTVDRCGRSCCVCDELIVLQIIDWKGILGGAVKNYGCVKFVACCRRLLWLKYYLNLIRKRESFGTMKQRFEPMLPIGEGVSFL